MEIALYSFMLLATIYVVVAGRFPTSLSNTYYTVSETFFENYCWIMSSCLWMVALYSASVYDNFLRAHEIVYEGEGYWWIWNTLAAISFMGVAIYGRYKDKQRIRHFIHAGLALVFAAIDVGAFYTYSLFPGEHFLGIVGGTVATFFLAKKFHNTHKIMWAEMAAILLICGRNITLIL